MDHNDNAIIAWKQIGNYTNSGIEAIYKSERNGLGNSWPVPGFSSRVSGSFQCLSPNLDMNDDGEIIIGWAEATTATFDGTVQIQRAVKTGGVWDALTSGIVSKKETGSTGPVIVISNNADADALMVWQQNDGFIRQVFMAERRGGVWSDPGSLLNSISPNGTESEAYSEAAAINDKGASPSNTMIIWSQSDGFNNQLFMSGRR